MTPEEFKNKMLELQINEDSIDDRHIHMDGLMCEVLESFGYKEGIDIFYDTEKWYA